jgi:hypothetical protein
VRRPSVPAASSRIESRFIVIIVARAEGTMRVPAASSSASTSVRIASTSGTT